MDSMSSKSNSPRLSNRAGPLDVAQCPLNENSDYKKGSIKEDLITLIRPYLISNCSLLIGIDSIQKRD